jgi:transposase
MRFVPVKSVEQQSMLCVHKLREGFKEERTACINRIRGLLAEFGLVFAQSPEALRAALPEALEDASNELGSLARLALERAAAHWRELDEHLAWCDQRIAQHHRDNDDVRRAAQLIGIGPVSASAAIATVGDFKQFTSGSQFGAWVGLVPRQHSSSGKSHLGGITKHGQTYLRTLLIQAAKSAVMTAHRRNDPISRWVLALRERSGWQVLLHAFEHWRELDEHMRWCDRQVGQHVRSSPQALRAAKITGIGELGASALTASVGEFRQFRSAHQFGAWLGLVPSQNSSGGKASLGRITKRGDDYLRTLMIQGAKSAVMSAGKRDDATSRWLVQLIARVGWHKACVAMANKNARILWAVMTRDDDFNSGQCECQTARQGCHARAPASCRTAAGLPNLTGTSINNRTTLPSTKDMHSKMH